MSVSGLVIGLLTVAVCVLALELVFVYKSLRRKASEDTTHLVKIDLETLLAMQAIAERVKKLEKSITVVGPTGVQKSKHNRPG